jgi:hypothetical protein
MDIAQDDLPEDYDPQFIITPIGLRRLALEMKEDAGTIGRKEAQELREIRAGMRQLSEEDRLETIIPHLNEFQEVSRAMRRLSELRGYKTKAQRQQIRRKSRRDPRFIAF